ncbi:DNA polymerase Y family protein [Undibacterium piscinae]|uniref:DNA polymerase Y family protein n=1 Tax=Undibacterium piscinae TaxID=2495591 RepID=A0A6M4A089_9BURK|nr:DNA polymerase Y family protein [Undibacterium piscinae]
MPPAPSAKTARPTTHHPPEKRPPASLWLAVHLPQLATEAFRPNWLADDGAVVLDKNRVVAISALARAAGVQVGMRSGSVHMLLPGATLQQHDVALENDLLHKVAIALLQYSPQVAGAERASLLMNIGASLRLFGGVRQLRRRVAASMAALGVTASLGYATNATAAWLLAQAAAASGRHGKYCLNPAKLARQLDPLALKLLPAAAPWHEWLNGIACHDLKSLRQLPRAGLQRRCGKALLSTLDYAYGEATQLHQWLTVPAQFFARSELPERIEHAEAIFNFAHALLQQLCGWLSAKQLAVSQIQLLLEHERGRLAVLPTEIIITLAEASNQAEHLARLLKERLAQLSLVAPAIALSLHATQVAARQAASASLFPEPGNSKQDQHRLLELLVARLGAENVLQAAPRADYRPELANHWVSAMPARQHAISATTAAAAAATTAAACAFRPPPGIMNRPAWLLASAIPLEVRQHRPCYGSTLTLLSPAERIEAGWWNGQLVTRDYFVAENSEHLRCWIYRERVSASQQLARNEADAAWYLHGWFG